MVYILMKTLVKSGNFSRNSDNDEEEQAMHSVNIPDEQGQATPSINIRVATYVVDHESLLTQ